MPCTVFIMDRPLQQVVDVCQGGKGCSPSSRVFESGQKVFLPGRNASAYAFLRLLLVAVRNSSCQIAILSPQVSQSLADGNAGCVVRAARARSCSWAPGALGTYLLRYPASCVTPSLGYLAGWSPGEAGIPGVGQGSRSCAVPERRHHRVCHVRKQMCALANARRHQARE